MQCYVVNITYVIYITIWIFVYEEPSQAYSHQSNVFIHSTTLKKS